MVLQDETEQLESTLIVAREYSYDDQLAFARISGDYNPIHVDPIEARRLLFGEIVVHGVHNILWALNVISEQLAKPIKLKALKVKFMKPVMLQKTVYLKIIWLTSNSVDCRIYASEHCHDSALCTIAVVFDEYVGAYHYQPSMVDFPIKCSIVPKQLLAYKSARLAIDFNSSELNKLYPDILSRIDSRQLGFILTTTRLVGMECPGLNSLYIGITIDFNSQKTITARDYLVYDVVAINEQINAMTMDVTSADIKGTIQCLLRPEKVAQITIKELQSKVTKQVFLPQKVLIIGGSRGLGELTAKILACGGAGKINFTYHSGHTDALHVMRELVVTSSHVNCFQYDVLSDEINPHEKEIFTNISHCYYFASTKILPSNGSSLNRKLLNDYLNSYLYGLERVVNKLLTYSDDKIKIFHPSTIFIENLEPNFSEYSIAKSAVELYGQFLEKNHANIQFVNVRFPKMKTDQTSSILPEELQDPVELLLNYLVANKE